MAGRRLLPAEHLADTGYLSAAMVVMAERDHDMELIGPTSWTKSGTGIIKVQFARKDCTP